MRGVLRKQRCKGMIKRGAYGTQGIGSNPRGMTFNGQTHFTQRCQRSKQFGNLFVQSLFSFSAPLRIKAGLGNELLANPFCNVVHQAE